MKVYSELVTALKNTNIPFAEHAWDTRPAVNFGVVSVDGAAASFQADQHTVNQAPQGTVDLFTYNNDRTDMETIQAVLNGFEGCAWYLESVQYEDTPRLIHWEWAFSLESW